MEYWVKIYEHVKKIDYEKYILHTDTDQISCWLGRNSSMTCRIIAKEKTCIPANSSAWVSVKIHSQKHLKTQTAFVESIESSQAYLLPGVIKTGVSEELRYLNIVNCSKESVTIYPNTTIGTCISVNENESVQSVKENEPVQITFRCTETTLGQPTCQELPECLNNLFARSLVHLNEMERNQLKAF